MKRPMILTMTLLLMLPMLAACGEDAQQIPTVVPTLAADGAPDADSPRLPGAPARQVPPTWTPLSRLAAPTRLTPPPETAAEGSSSAGSDQAQADSETYVVQAGDTLAEIAADFGVDLDLLAEVNAIEDIDVIEVGQELFIPAQ